MAKRKGQIVDLSNLQNNYTHSNEYDDVIQQQQPSNKRNRNKKICELGVNCPYRNEYQHQLEFDHLPHPQQSNRQNKVTSKSKEHHSSNNNSGIYNHVKMSKPNYLGDVPKHHPFVENVNVEVERNNLKRQQEEEYDAMILNDVLKISMEEHKRNRSTFTHSNHSSSLSSSHNNNLTKNATNYETIDLSNSPEEDSYLQIMKRVKIQDHEINKRRKVEEEPPLGPNVITLGFKLPSTVILGTTSTTRKLMRNFHVSSTIEEVYEYLTDHPLLKGINCICLRQVIGPCLDDDMKRFSLQQVGIISNSILIVQDMSL